MSRQYSFEEMQILVAQQFVPFTEDELKQLAKGEGTIKTEYKADKAIAKYKDMMLKPMSRNEALRNFVTFSVHNKLHNAVVTLQELLISKELTTKEELQKFEHELIVKEMSHLCDHCTNWEISCKAKATPQLAKQQFPDLDGELAEKVIRCPQFVEHPQQGSC